MGLGKTVEVLALILTHTRQDVKQDALTLPEVQRNTAVLQRVGTKDVKRPGSAPWAFAWLLSQPLLCLCEMAYIHGWLVTFNVTLVSQEVFLKWCRPTSKRIYSSKLSVFQLISRTFTISPVGASHILPTLKALYCHWMKNCLFNYKPQILLDRI